jgi:5-methylcytosine-specific restriction endonuclease McrA
MLQMPELKPAARAGNAEELERLGDEIATLSAHVHAATYALLVLLLEFDQREGWSRGFRSCAHWLSWRTGIAPGAAREKVRVARSLEHLPQTSEAMRRGEFSFAKVRAITRVATPDNETALVDVARHATAAQVEKIVRGWRRVDRLEEQCREQRQHEARYLSVYVDEDGMYEVRGRLSPEVGALLRRALESGVEALYGHTPSQPEDREHQRSTTATASTPSQRRSDAIGLVAERALVHLKASESPVSASLAPMRPVELVVHVDAQALALGSNKGQSVLDDRVHVSAETSRRLACFATRRLMTHDQAGSVLDVGRRTRAISSALLSALQHRDGGCRFPGCGLRYCDAHHIVHWADGGSTRLDNLVLLCRRHHRYVHEEGYRVIRLENGELQFQSPTGDALLTTPRAVNLAGDSVAALKAKHESQGLGIAEMTTMQHWHGERLDLDHALRTLRRRRQD